MPTFPFYSQLDAMDCGPTCLRMVAKYYGKTYTLQNLRDKSGISREGVSLQGISEAAEQIGFRTLGVKVDFDKLVNDVPLPCIVHWKQAHFVVLYGIKKRNRFNFLTFPSRSDVGKLHQTFQRPPDLETSKKRASPFLIPNSKFLIKVADPAIGLVTYSQEEFLSGWLSNKQDGEAQGVCLLLEPTTSFYEAEDEKQDRTQLKFLWQYLTPHKKFFVQLILGLLTGSLLQLIFPFLTQAIVDFGIANQNLTFIYLVLVAQLVLFASRLSVEFLRNWILLHISTRINIALISDFLIKLMKLPLGFFDTKLIGDLMQRIGDQSRIQNFLTSSSLNILFSFVNLVIFGIVLVIYSIPVFFIFLTGSVLYTLWIWLFMKYRRDLDFKRFAQLADNQSKLYQLITGMQEIKLNNCERNKRWEWERIQAKLFKISVRSLALSQYQQAGSVFINETKNIVISFLAAKAVIDGSMTLGMMMSVQYIIGQLNSPIEQLLTFFQSAQDAKISLERMNEIHTFTDEEQQDINRLNYLPAQRDISLNKLSFQYGGNKKSDVLKTSDFSELVLVDVNLQIPEHKITAIVGTSGSGKTTLIKLLLGFYEPIGGNIKIGETSLNNINVHLWRSKCGVVMQDGYIFSDSIANNIALTGETIDKERLLHAVRVANIHDFIETLPLNFNTKIGQEGHGLSQGQKQRILIARAVYKNPEYIFFDEATNALDANNEKVIMQNLDTFFKGKTVVVVAHRLSTVKHADQIVVLEKGKIVEIGTHATLTDLRGAYYELVKNQLELGN